jgi:hypothetical protein
LKSSIRIARLFRLESFFESCKADTNCRGRNGKVSHYTIRRPKQDEMQNDNDTALSTNSIGARYATRTESSIRTIAIRIVSRMETTLPAAQKIEDVRTDFKDVQP